MPMRKAIVRILAAFACIAAAIAAGISQEGSISSWDPRAAASYLDSRQSWWMTFPNAARDHETSCVSCHTTLPYALARPALRASTRETALSVTERKLLDNVTKRVRLWQEVEPYYPDQTRGLPKTSESRGTEAILNALILATYDARAGGLTDESRQAFSNLWALQFKTGDLAGAWAWLNFHLEPWESSGGSYFGAALAAIAVGTAPGEYASSSDIQDRLKPLREYLRRGVETEYPFNRLMTLWASTKLSSLLTPDQRRAIIDSVLRLQHDDGGWTMSSLGPWKRTDGTPQETNSDGYATGLIAFVLQQAGVASTEPAIRNAILWLVRHQNRTSGMWTASSLNKQRDPETDIGRFMSDAATAYAVLALTSSH
jgi:squalene-hopene/tetraprenyl-beta-curcumene cyclase